MHFCIPKTAFFRKSVHQFAKANERGNIRYNTHVAAQCAAEPPPFFAPRPNVILLSLSRWSGSWSASAPLVELARNRSKLMLISTTSNLNQVIIYMSLFVSSVPSSFPHEPSQQHFSFAWTPSQLLLACLNLVSGVSKRASG